MAKNIGVAKKLGVIIFVLAAFATVWRCRANNITQEEERATETESSAINDTPSRETSALSLADRLRNLKTGNTHSNHGPLGGHGRVKGIVVALGSNERVAGVDVLFNGGAGEETASSNEDGEFSIKLAAGNYQVRAIGEQLIALSQPSIRVLPCSEDTPPLQIKVVVTKLAHLRGQVIDYASSSGNPITVRFIIETSAEQAKVKSGLLIDQVPVDDDGTFELNVLPKKQLTIEARSGYRRGRLLVKNIVAGEERTGLQIELAKGVEISGQVLDPRGTPVSGAQVSAALADTKHGQTTTSGPGGQFHLEPIASGDIIVEAWASGFAQSVPLRKEYKNGATPNLNIRLQGKQTLSGKVLDIEGNPIEGVRLRVGRDGSRLGAIDSYSSSEGTFRFDALDRGDYWMSAVKGGYATTTTYVKPPQDGVKVTLSHFGSIRGTVTTSTGTAVTDFVVKIESFQALDVKRPKPRSESMRFREESGVYELSDLEPGSYRLSIKGTGNPVTLTVNVSPSKVADGSTTLTVP